MLKCLAKKPDQRFASTDDLGDALRECVADRAFLRDASRLPGIQESGLDLSQAIPSAQDNQLPPADVLPEDEPVGDEQPAGDDQPAGDEQPAGDDELAHLDSLDLDGFSSTMRIDGFRARRRRRLLVGAAIVILAGAGSALWVVRKNPTPEKPPEAPVAATPPLAAPPAPLPPAAAPPAAVKAPEPLPVLAAKPAQPSEPPASPPASSADRTPARPRRTLDEVVRRAPAEFPPSSPTPRTLAPPEPAPAAPAELAPPPAAPAEHAPPPAAPAEHAPPPAAPAPAAPVRPAGDPEALVHEAQQAWIRHHFAVAIDNARSALALTPDLPLAYQIIAACSCAMHNADDARQASAHLDPARRKLVRAVCEKDGVILDPD